MNEETKENPFAPYSLQYDISERKGLVAQMMQAMRKAKNFSQKQVADLLGISAQTYNGYEKGRNEPPLEILVRLSFLYDTSIDLLAQRNNLTKTYRDAESQLASYRKQLTEIEEQLRESPENNPQLEALMQAMKQLTEGIAVYTEANKDKFPK